MRRFVPTIVTLMLLPVLIGLGFWQLDRAEQKEAAKTLVQIRGQETAQRISSSPVDAAAIAHYKVVVSGRYAPRHQFYLDNKVHQGRAGYHVITPLRIDSGNSHVLINRGWLPWGDNRDRLPEISIPAGKQEIMGIAVTPPEKFFQLAPAQEIGDTWPKVWQNLDLQRFSRAVSFPVQPIVIVLDPDKSGGFVRDWRPGPRTFGPERHRAYAFQWFSLAAALAAIYLVVNVRRNK